MRRKKESLEPSGMQDTDEEEECAGRVRHKDDGSFMT